MLALVLARIVFSVGFTALLFILPPNADGQILLAVMVAYILFCELVVARRIKSKAAPPLSRRQKSIALIPWLLPILVVALVLILTQ